MLKHDARATHACRLLAPELTLRAYLPVSVNSLAAQRCNRHNATEPELLTTLFLCEPFTPGDAVIPSFSAFWLR